MFKRTLAGVSLAVFVAACSGSPAATGNNPTGQPGETSAPATQEGTATQDPGSNPGNAGDFEAVARALMPQGATETTHIATVSSYTLYAESDQSLADLEAFWTQAVPAAGATLTGHFNANETVIVAFTNPNGGITAIPDASTGKTVVVISVGTNG